MGKIFLEFTEYVVLVKEHVSFAAQRMISLFLTALSSMLRLLTINRKRYLRFVSNN
jgi:hypothetical protein